MFESRRSLRSSGKPKTKEGWIKKDCQIETGNLGREQHVSWRVALGLKTVFVPQGRTSPSAKEGLLSSLRRQEREQHGLQIRE